MGIPTSRVSCLQIEASICAVLTADAVATGKVNCYHFILRLCSLHDLWRQSARATVAQVNDLWLVRISLMNNIHVIMSVNFRHCITGSLLD